MNTTTAPATTLRARINAMTQASAMIAIQAQAVKTMTRSSNSNVQSNVVAIQPVQARTVQQRVIDSVLQQAKNNLATANTIRQHNAKLGGALQSLAMGDMNSLRAKKATWKRIAVVAEYSNLGKFWE